MKYQVLLCIFLMLASSVDVSVARSRKKKHQKKVVKTEEMFIEEIENYDFLYTDTEGFLPDLTSMDNIMDEALSHIGARYRSGSKGPSAFDCSGFTSYVYGQQTGIDIGASSRDQYARNTPIKREEMQRGDLVFFTSPGSGRGVGHVGIVVDVDPMTGEFTFIHASSKSGVKISNSTDGYYSQRYIGVRRVAQ